MHVYIYGLESHQTALRGAAGERHRIKAPQKANGGNTPPPLLATNNCIAKTPRATSHNLLDTTSRSGDFETHDDCGMQLPAA